MDNRNVAGPRAVQFRLTAQWIVVGLDGQTVAGTLCYPSAELALQAGIQARRAKLHAPLVEQLSQGIEMEEEQGELFLQVSA
jgi:hypothetical protein